MSYQICTFGTIRFLMLTNVRIEWANNFTCSVCFWEERQLALNYDFIIWFYYFQNCCPVDMSIILKKFFNFLKNEIFFYIMLTNLLNWKIKSKRNICCIINYIISTQHGFKKYKIVVIIHEYSSNRGQLRLKHDHNKQKGENMINIYI